MTLQIRQKGGCAFSAFDVTDCLALVALNDNFQLKNSSGFRIYSYFTICINKQSVQELMGNPAADGDGTKNLTKQINTFLRQSMRIHVNGNISETGQHTASCS